MFSLFRKKTKEKYLGVENYNPPSLNYKSDEHAGNKRSNNFFLNNISLLPPEENKINTSIQLENEADKNADSVTGNSKNTPEMESSNGYNKNTVDRNHSPGNEKLPDDVQKHFESKFNHNFSKVRIHNNEQSENMANKIGARAFTEGNHVYFGKNEYVPHSISTNKLLAHELTHVVQQTSGRVKGVQPKLIVEGKNYEYDSKPVQWTLNHFKISETGKTHLKKIIKSKGIHKYSRWGMLGYDLRSKDKMAEAAMEVNDKMGFAREDLNPRFNLDSKYWNRIDNETFEAKGLDYAEAFNAIFKDKTKNRLECKGLARVMALRAFHLSVGDAVFNRVLKRNLRAKKPFQEKATREKFRIPLNEKLIAPFSLDAEISSGYYYEGEKEYLPGDLVIFSAWEIPQADGTIWQVENAIMVGWNAKKEPLFVGGGLPGKKYTESEMKAEICKKIGVEPNQTNTDKIELSRETNKLDALGGKVQKH